MLLCATSTKRGIKNLQNIVLTLLIRNPINTAHGMYERPATI